MTTMFGHKASSDVPNRSQVKVVSCILFEHTGESSFYNVNKSETQTLQVRKLLSDLQALAAPFTRISRRGIANHKRGIMSHFSTKLLRFLNCIRLIDIYLFHQHW